jgi:hypothetical protein
MAYIPEISCSRPFRISIYSEYKNLILISEEGAISNIHRVQEILIYVKLTLF